MKTRQRLLALGWTSVLAVGIGLIGTAWHANAVDAAGGKAPPHMKDGKVVPPPQPTVPTAVTPGMPATLMREAEHGHSKGGAMAPADAVHRQNGQVWVD